MYVELMGELAYEGCVREVMMGSGRWVGSP
jgi:hypothetical protein